MPVTPPAIEPPVITFATQTTPRRTGLPALRLKVLVVDDNRDAADTLAALLMLCGADVRVCYDGAAGVREAEAFRPDVGLFDVNMPWMNGCELARHVRADSGGRGGERRDRGERRGRPAADGRGRVQPPPHEAHRPRRARRHARRLRLVAAVAGGDAGVGEG